MLCTEDVYVSASAVPYSQPATIPTYCSACIDLHSITEAEPARPMHAGSSRSGESVVQPDGRSYDTEPYREILVGVELSCKPCHVPMLQPVISTAHYGVRPTTSGHSVNIVILMMTHIIKWGRGRRLLHRAMLPT